LVTNRSLASPNSQPFGIRRSSTSENTPWVFSPTRVTFNGRFMSACVKVSAALTLCTPINSTTGPRNPGRSLGRTTAGCAGVHFEGSAGSLRACFEYAV
jgi:hypothetical protein